MSKISGWQWLKRELVVLLGEDEAERFLQGYWQAHNDYVRERAEEKRKVTRELEAVQAEREKQGLPRDEQIDQLLQERKQALRRGWERRAGVPTGWAKRAGGALVKEKKK